MKGFENDGGLSPTADCGSLHLDGMGLYRSASFRKLLRWLRLWAWEVEGLPLILAPNLSACVPSPWGGPLQISGVWARAAQEKAPFHWKCWDCRWSSHLKPEVKYCISLGFPGGSDDKESAFNVGDLGSISGLRTSLGKGNGYPLQYSCLENPMDRGNWQAIVHGVAKCKRGQTGLSD